MQEAAEIEEAGKAGIIPVTLGRRILRTETAAITVLGWLMYLLEVEAAGAERTYQIFENCPEDRR